MSNFNVNNFMLKSWKNDKKFTIVKACRRTGKTFDAFIWICFNLLKNEKKRGLWVDTVQANLSKYVERYLKNEILQEIFTYCKYDNQKNILTFPNYSTLDLASAEKPQNLEGFEYDFVVLNEAGIILKNDGLKSGLWESSILPMCKNAFVKIVGTPKGKGTKYEKLCEQAKLNEEDWQVHTYTVYDSPRYAKEEIEKIKRSTTEYYFRQEYLAEFTSAYENSIIKYEYLNYYNSYELNIEDITDIYIHIDTTHTAKTTSDFAGIGAIGINIKDNKYYLIDYIIEHLEVDEQIEKLIHMYKKFINKVRKITYDEKSHNSFGLWAIKIAREQYNLSLPLEPLKFGSDKVTHLQNNFVHFKSGRFIINADNKYKERLEMQLLAFPSNNVNDDGVDLVSSLLDNFNEVSNVVFA